MNKLNSRFNAAFRLSLCLLLGGLIGATTAQASFFKTKKKEMQVRTTAYTHSESDHLKYARQTAAGTTLKAGKVNSAAADWSFLPLGTTFRIKGQKTLYKVEDYGRALVGTKTIDIYRPSRGSMNDWGVRHVEIEIVKKGCIETSINLLKGRTHHAHCRKMLEQLRKQA